MVAEVNTSSTPQESPSEREMDFEDVLEAVGGYGKYQRRLVWGFLVPISLTIPFLGMYQIFMLSTPAHWCHVANVSSSMNLSQEDKQMLTSPRSKEMKSLTPIEGCKMYNLSYGDVLNDLIVTGMNISYYVDTYSANWSTIACQHGWDYDKSLYWRTATTDWNLVCDESYIRNLGFSLVTAGSAVGTPIFGAASDKIGRKVSFFAASIIGIITAVLTVTIPSLIGFLVIRTINGTLLPSVFQLPFLILVEIVSPEMRARASAVSCLGWTVGLAIMPLIAWLTADWVWLGWICAACTFPYIAYYWFLPESPRWLISQGRFEEANDVFQKIAKVNGKNISHLDLVSLLKKCVHKQKEENKDAKVSPVEFFRKPTLFRRFILLTISWTADCIAYYGFHINVSALYGNEFVNFFLLALVEFPSYITGWYMMESKLGRRWSNVIFLLLSAIVCILPVMEPEDSTTLTTIAALVGKFGVSASFMVIYQQTAEIFPTPLRASGLGVIGTLASIISICTPSIIYLSKYGHHIPFTVMALICFLASGCSVFIPETLNENLPQTVEDGEFFGKDKAFFSLANTIKPEKKYNEKDGSFREKSTKLSHVAAGGGDAVKL